MDTICASGGNVHDHLSQSPLQSRPTVINGVGMLQNKYAFDVNYSIFPFLFKLHFQVLLSDFPEDGADEVPKSTRESFKRSRLSSGTKMFTPLSFMRPKCPSHLPNYLLKGTNNEASQAILPTLLTILAHVQLSCKACLTVTPWSMLVYYALKMEAAGSFERSVNFCQSVRCHVT